jgi:hypothetical protein
MDTQNKRIKNIYKNKYLKYKKKYLFLEKIIGGSMDNISNDKESYMNHPNNINKYTSDHILIPLELEFENVKLKGFTWNLLKYCDSMNNVFKLNESLSEYIDRKKTQINLLLNTIRRGNYHFVFLQEADFLDIFPNNDMLNNLNRLKDGHNETELGLIIEKYKIELKNIVKHKERLRNIFLTELEKLGFDCIIDTKKERKKDTAILYSKKVFKFTNNIEPIFLNNKRKYQGFAIIVEDIRTKNIINLGCLHLNFLDSKEDTENFAHKIAAYQNKFDISILGGDTNSVYNRKQITDKLKNTQLVFPTCSSVIYFDKVTNKPTNKYPIDENYEKTYDGFFIHSKKKCTPSILQHDCWNSNFNNIFLK